VWRASHTARRQAPSRNFAAPSSPSGPQACRQAPHTIRAFTAPFPLGETHTAARRLACTGTTATILG